MCSAASPSATEFPANENVALLVEGQLNPPNFCCTWVVSQLTSMLRKSARPWWLCVCTCVHACVYVCTCVCVHGHVHMCMLGYACVCTCVCMCACMCVCVCQGVGMCVYVCWGVQMCACIACMCMYVCMLGVYVCVCAHISPCSWPPGGGHPVSSTKAQLRPRTRVFQGRLHLRPSPSTAEAKGQTLVKSPDELLPPSYCHGDIKPSTIWGSDGWFLVLCLEKQ